MRVLVPHRLFIAGEDLHQLARRATSDNSITTACGSLKSPESKAPISPMIRLPQEAATPRMAKGAVHFSARRLCMSFPDTLPQNLREVGDASAAVP